MVITYDDLMCYHINSYVLFFSYMELLTYKIKKHVPQLNTYGALHPTSLSR